MKNCPYCGQQTSDEVRFCGKCGKEIVTTPQESPNNEMNLTQQEQSSDTTAILSQKKRSKKKYLWILVFLFLIAGGIAFYFLGYPYIQYQQAINDLEAGNYSSAKAVFVELGDYKEAPNYITEADYRIAKQVAETDLLEGLELLKKMGSYKDSEELVVEQKNRIFEAVKKCINLHEFSQAENYINAIPDVEGIQDCKNELTYQRALDYEDKCQYSSSKAEFEKIRGYKDVNDRLGQLVYKLMGNMYIATSGNSLYGSSQTISFKSDSLWTYWVIVSSLMEDQTLEREYYYRIENNIIYGTIKSENDTSPISRPSAEIGRITDIVKDKNGKITKIQISGLFTDEPVWFS